MTQRRLRLLAGAIVLVPLLAYPVVSLAGDGPRFPSRDECARVAEADTETEVEVVYGRLDDPAAAEALLAKLTDIGFVGADLALDACGRWKVYYDGVESIVQAEALAEQVREAGFDARVELAL